MLYTLPFRGRNRITSPYGPRTVNGVKDLHNGFDIVGDDGTDIGAAQTPDGDMTAEPVPVDAEGGTDADAAADGEDTAGDETGEDTAE